MKRHTNKPFELNYFVFLRGRITLCDMIMGRATRKHYAVTIPTSHLLLILAFTFLIPPQNLSILLQRPTKRSATKHCKHCSIENVNR